LIISLALLQLLARAWLIPLDQSVFQTLVQDKHDRAGCHGLQAFE